MAKKVTNEQIMDRFRAIEEYRSLNSNDHNKILGMQNDLIKDLEFLVRFNTRRYRSLPNYDDLNQEGFIGLTKAVRVFDYKRFPNFFVFAGQWIMNSVKRAAKKYDIVYNPDRKRVVYKTDEEMETLAVDQTSLDEILDENKMRRALHETINSLTSRERLIINKLFGFGDENCTLRGVEKHCDISYERIRQIKNRVLDRLRSNQTLLNIIES